MNLVITLLDLSSLLFHTREEMLSIYFLEQLYSPQTLQAQAMSIAEILHVWGINQGQIVGIWLRNSPLAVVIYLGLLRLGVIVVWLNRRLTSHEISQQLDRVGGEVIITDQQLQSDRYRVITVDAIAINLPNSELESKDSLGEIAANSLQLFFTSGTTGTPKAVPLTVANLQCSAIAVNRFLQDKGITEHRWLLCLPLYHVGGLGIIWRNLLARGIIYLTEPFDPATTIRLVAEQQVNLVSLVPTMLHRLLKQEQLINTLNYWQKMAGIFLGGAKADRALLQHCLELKLPILVTYGMTETASQISILDLLKYPQKMESVGQVLPHMHLQIRDEEIHVQSPALMRNYWGYPPLTDYWATGDLGHIDQDGFLYLHDRRTNLIISGGENIYPAELEAILCSHPQIQTVCVLPKPDPEWGQVPAVIYSGEELTLAEVQAYCLQCQLARYKLPKYLLRLECLPHTALGKIDRSSLRNRLADLDCHQDTTSTPHPL